MRIAIPAVMLLALALLITTAAQGHSGEGAHEDEASPQQSTLPDVAPEARRNSPGKGKEPHSPASAYKPDNVLGWKMHVHEDLIADKDLHKLVMEEMHHQLFRITRVLPKDKVDLLKKVPVWIELRNPYSSNCQYHPSKRWLENNGYLAEKANCIEISDAKRFVNTSQRIQPFVMLHELAHSYHDLHLNFGHPKIVDAYKKAKASGTYDKVLHMVGREVRAYAMVDHKEYFAESTEAYFGTNDHYPFVRPELKKHDPLMYEVVREVWGLKK